MLDESISTHNLSSQCLSNNKQVTQEQKENSQGSIDLMENSEHLTEIVILLFKWHVTVFYILIFKTLVEFQTMLFLW